MTWSVLKNFELQWNTFKALTEEDKPKVPKLNPKNFPAMGWSKSFVNKLHRSFGTRLVPLLYVVQGEATVPHPAPLVASGMPYAVCFDTMMEGMIARDTHSHPLFLVDNKAVFHLLEEATRNTAYAPSLAFFFAKKHDGCGAYFAIMSQYAGEDKWLAEVKV